MRHFAANYIFDGENLIKNAYVSTDQAGFITYVSDENEALIEKPRMTFSNGIICPGFVNAHCHLELSGIDRNNINNNGLSAFIQSIINLHNKPKNRIKIKSSDNDMYLLGTNLCGDVVNTTATIEIKTNSKIKYVSFAEQSGIIQSEAKQRFESITKIAREFEESGLEVSVVPHSFYSVSKKLLYLIAETCSHKPISVHFMESKQEKELYSGIESELYKLMLSINPDYKPLTNEVKDIYNLLSLFNTAENLILVHNVKTEKSFAEKYKNIYYCLCPSSNLNLHNELPDSKLVYENKDRIIIGTDSLASNDRLDIFTELKLIKENYPELTMIDLLRIISINGAKALGHNDYGRLKHGISPGLVLICDADLHNLTINDKTYTKRII